MQGWAGRAAGPARWHYGQVYQRVLRTRAEWMAGYRRVLEARDRETPPDRLRVLAGDEVRPVRIFVAMNRATPADALARLSADEDWSVRRCALLNPCTPAHALHEMARAEQRQLAYTAFWDRHFIAVHPNTDPALRTQLLAAGACDCPGSCHVERGYQAV
jgi:hypothetical protein